MLRGTLSKLWEYAYDCTLKRHDVGNEGARITSTEAIDLIAGASCCI